MPRTARPPCGAGQEVGVGACPKARWHATAGNRGKQALPRPPHQRKQLVDDNRPEGMRQDGDAAAEARMVCHKGFVLGAQLRGDAVDQFLTAGPVHQCRRGRGGGRGSGRHARMGGQGG
eukprot:scaffold162596_cov24-Tisochrysis_lutea.AAC.2